MKHEFRRWVRLLANSLVNRLMCWAVLYLFIIGLPTVYVLLSLSDLGKLTIFQDELLALRRAIYLIWMFVLGFLGLEAGFVGLQRLNRQRRRGLCRFLLRFRRDPLDVESELEDLERVYQYDEMHWGPFIAKCMYAVTVSWRFGQKAIELVPGVKFLKNLSEKIAGGDSDAS